ncbi:MAG TPA: lytic transglycosylase domain-containing protein [Nocardioides sp.]|nr:lytic transglycosylase domain-containing protein [Nocardioides sp.]
MSRKRLGRLQRAATIVPLALLSMAWTASVYGIGGIHSPIAAAEESPAVSQDVSVPKEALDQEASVSDVGSIAGVDGNGAGIVNAASTNDIPSAALAAYQRAETVINSADKSCHLTWQLVAAIGRVESDHGRSNHNVLDDDGIARPGIYGKPLTGKRGLPKISDTDAGQLDRDKKWDRAVGPMQFIPSTWSVVGVDADNDSQRNPQDIDDAALASAVYLCSGNDDLSTVTGQRAAVYRYNHSQRYVDLVMSVMEAYLEGDFTAVPNNTTAAGYLVPNNDYYYNPGGSLPSSSDYNTDAGSGVTTTDETTTLPGTDTTDPGTDPGTTDPGTTPGTGAPDPGTTLNDTVNGVKDTVDQATGPVTNLLQGVLGALAPSDVKAACKDAYPNLTQVLQYTNCVLSYGLNP